MNADTFSTIMGIIFASLTMIYGIAGIFKGELHFQLGHGWKGVPITLTGKAGLASSISLIVGGALLIIGTRPIDSGFEQIISAAGCVIPIVVVGFCYIMQTLITIGRSNYESKQRVKKDKLTK